MRGDIHLLVRGGARGRFGRALVQAYADALEAQGWRCRITVLRRGKLHKLGRLRAIAGLMRRMVATGTRPDAVNLMFGEVAHGFLDFAGRNYLLVPIDDLKQLDGATRRAVDGVLAAEGEPADFADVLEARLANAGEPRPAPFAPADVNLIAWDNGVGLSRDLQLLADALVADGLTVEITRLLQGHSGSGQGLWGVLAPMPMRPKRFGVSIMLEHLRPGFFGEARATAFVPNPEWCLKSDVALLCRVDGVLAKTHHAVPIFEARGCRTAFIGFTSLDRFLPDESKARAFLHVAGKSEGKNTQLVLDTWLRHPEWPHLTVIQNAAMCDAPVVARNITHRLDHVPDDELRVLQNRYFFHICPSTAEGFGHYIAEALGTGSIVLATDGPPMNELVRPDYGLLIPVVSVGKQHLSPTFHIDAAGLEVAVEQAIALDDANLTRMGAAARQAFEAARASFLREAPAAVRTLLVTRAS